ncbi:22168_t:CDS:2 [Cetraspora pellucida]|uniref:22168_t:CDS:1 n=1 Tax=Cetraspora pellucida TaxID=1433469 RepID=A0A9N8W6X6_9GLOM|nr:22168_t:CDS:2 [Cetraspora pellucida]
MKNKPYLSPTSYEPDGEIFSSVNMEYHRRGSNNLTYSKKDKNTIQSIKSSLILMLLRACNNLKDLKIDGTIYSKITYLLADSLFQTIFLAPSITKDNRISSRGSKNAERSEAKNCMKILSQKLKTNLSEMKLRAIEK